MYAVRTEQPQPYCELSKNVFLFAFTISKQSFPIYGSILKLPGMKFQLLTVKNASNRSWSFPLNKILSSSPKQAPTSNHNQSPHKLHLLQNIYFCVSLPESKD